MPRVWNPEEADSPVYRNIEKSEGVITVRYRPPSQNDLENLKHTDIYSRMVREHSKGNAPLDEILPKG
jgi:hypothetical protein